MPIKTGTLTPQERIVAQARAAGASVGAAGEAAGYADNTGASRALARPLVAAEVARLQLERITNEALPLAVDVHIAMLRNPRTPAGALVQAIKLAYDRALGPGTSEGKEPHEMTADEIAKALNALKREQSDRAAPIIEHEATPTIFD